MKKLLVMDKRKPGEAPDQFDSAAAVATHMWGRDPQHYQIFVRADFLPLDCDKMEEMLRQMQLDCNNTL